MKYTNRRTLLKPSSRQSRRGFSLIVTLLSISLIAVVAFGLVTLSGIQSRRVQDQLFTKKAYNLARAGVVKAVGELKSDYIWPTTVNTDAEGRYVEVIREDNSGNLLEGYKVKVEPDPNNLNNPNKMWKVTSTGYYEGSKRTLESWLGMETFALYALFFDNGENSGFTNEDKMDGRVHSNRRFKLYGCPRFSQRATSANIQRNASGTVTWTDPDYVPATNRYKMATGVYTDDPSKFYWRYNTSGGQYGYNNYYFRALNDSPTFSFAGGQPEIPLPVYNNPEIYGTTTPKYFDYVEGKTNGYTFNVDVYLTFNSNGTVSIKNSSGTLLTKNKNNVNIVNPVSTDNLTLKTVGDVYLGYPRTDTGASVPQTFKGRTTIVAAKNSSGSKGNFYIKDSIIYNDKNSDVLGLVAENNVSVQTAKTQIGDLEIDASIMALNGSLTVRDPTSGSRRGDLIIFGGIVYSTISGTENASCTTGYGTRWSYDPKLYLKPPVNWPLTGKLRVISINDHGALK